MHNCMRKILIIIEKEVVCLGDILWIGSMEFFSHSLPSPWPLLITASVTADAKDSTGA